MTLQAGRKPVIEIPATESKWFHIHPVGHLSFLTAEELLSYRNADKDPRVAYLYRGRENRRRRKLRERSRLLHTEPLLLMTFPGWLTIPVTTTSYKKIILIKILHKTLSILDAGEKKKIWQLSLEDVIVSVMDIVFLVGLLFVIRFYTEPVSAQPLHGFATGRNLLDHHRVLFITLFLILFALKNFLGFWVSKQQYEFAYRVASRISKDNLQSYLHGSYNDYVHVDSSVINRRINQQPIEFSHFVLNGFQQIFTQLVLILLTTTAITLYNPLLFPFLLLFMVPPVLFIAFLIRKKLNTSRQLGKQTSEQSMQFLQEALSGFIESNTYGKNDFFTERYGRIQSRLNQYLAQRLVIQHMPSRMIEVFAVFGLYVLVIINDIRSGSRPFNGSRWEH